MKKLFIPLALLVFSFSSCKKDKKQEPLTTTDSQTEIIDSHTSQNALDWAGTYMGTLPCADCEGIKTTITLNQDETFTSEEEYLGESLTVKDQGIFVWDNTGNSIILHGEKDKRTRAFKVGENQIIHLDSDKNQITGNLAEAYILKKQ
ncbi:MAG: copper resistance protein NlpE [Flavobacteriaceae bacterium]